MGNYLLSNHRFALALVLGALGTLLAGTSSAQVANSYAPSPQGMYYHTVDTLAKVLRAKERIGKIAIAGEHQVTDEFPEKIAGLPVYIPEPGSKPRSWGLKSGNVVFTLRPLSIDRDKVSIRVLTAKWNGRGFSMFGPGAYTATYRYMPDKGHFELASIRGGE